MSIFFMAESFKSKKKIHFAQNQTIVREFPECTLSRILHCVHICSDVPKSDCRSRERRNVMIHHSYPLLAIYMFFLVWFVDLLRIVSVRQRNHFKPARNYSKKLVTSSIKGRVFPSELDSP